VVAGARPYSDRLGAAIPEASTMRGDVVASGSVVAYAGKRGTVYRIVYREHPKALQRKETIGPDRKAAEKALRARLAACEDGSYVPAHRLDVRHVLRPVHRRLCA